jgi:hypothetical protein
MTPPPLVPSTPRTLLYFTALPDDCELIRSDRELRGIEDALERSPHRHRYTVKHYPAADARTLRRALGDLRTGGAPFAMPGEEPRAIVHFSVHGAGADGLILEGPGGGAQPISAEALERLFQDVAGRVECVVLNACWSDEQAEAIGRHIRYVVGMKKQVYDRAAIEFSVGFYDALFKGRSYEEALEEGRNGALCVVSGADEMPRLHVLVKDAPPVAALEAIDSAGTNAPHVVGKGALPAASQPGEAGAAAAPGPRATGGAASSTSPRAFILHHPADFAEAAALGRLLGSRDVAVRLGAWEQEIGDSVIGWAEEALGSAAFVVLCYSSRPLDEPYVSRQWEAALARQLEGARVRILPVYLTGRVAPALMAGILAADWQQEPERAVDLLVRAMMRRR